MELCGRGGIRAAYLRMVGASVFDDDRLQLRGLLPLLAGAQIGAGAVGQYPKGNGRYGHTDLGGNLGEWLLDSSASYANPCTNCAAVDATATREVRGGSFYTVTADLLAGHRNGLNNPWNRGSDMGVRCANPDDDLRPSFDEADAALLLANHSHAPLDFDPGARSSAPAFPALRLGSAMAVEGARKLGAELGLSPRLASPTTLDGVQQMVCRQDPRRTAAREGVERLHSRLEH